MCPRVTGRYSRWWMLPILALVFIVSSKWLGYIFFQPVLESAVVCVSEYIPVSNATKKNLVNIFSPVFLNLSDAKWLKASWRDNISRKFWFRYYIPKEFLINNIANFNSFFIRTVWIEPILNANNIRRSSPVVVNNEPLGFVEITSDWVSVFTSGGTHKYNFWRTEETSSNKISTLMHFGGFLLADCHCCEHDCGPSKNYGKNSNKNCRNAINSSLVLVNEDTKALENGRTFFLLLIAVVIGIVGFCGCALLICRR